MSQFSLPFLEKPLPQGDPFICATGSRVVTEVNAETMCFTLYLRQNSCLFFLCCWGSRGCNPMHRTVERGGDNEPWDWVAGKLARHVRQSRSNGSQVYRHCLRAHAESCLYSTLSSVALLKAGFPADPLPKAAVAAIAVQWRKRSGGFLKLRCS